MNSGRRIFHFTVLAISSFILWFRKQFLVTCDSIADENL